MTATSRARLEFGLELPTRIRFGPGVRMEAGQAAAGSGRRVALFVGRSFTSNLPAQDVQRSLGEAGLEVVLELPGDGEPDDAAVLEAAARLRDARAEVVVAVGGGSVLDLAKAASLLPDQALLAAMLGGQRVARHTGLPVVALPTTAGSGAEVSHGAIILDRPSGRKRGIRGPGVAARVALVDPDLSRSAPPAIAASSGFDAIAHAVETAASRAASDLAVLLAGRALGRLLPAVQALVSEPGDDEARAAAAYAALLMGINLSLSTTCLPHRLQYPLGALTGTGHAVGVAALMPAWLERTARHAPAALARLARAAGLAELTLPDAEAAAGLVGAIQSHLDATGLRRRLSELGVRPSDVPGLVAAVEGTLANDPGPISEGDLADLYLASL